MCSIIHRLDHNFATISHTLLLDKLHSYWFRGKVFELIKSYLTDRKQYVYTNVHNSNIQKIPYAVPVSVSIPFFFILFINDLKKISNNGNFILFVVDTRILFSEMLRSYYKIQ